MPNRVKEWTIVVLSENQARVRQFLLKRNWFYAGVAGSIAVVTLLLVFGVLTWHYSSQVRDNTALQAKVAELEATNERIRDIAERLSELKQFEQQLRRGLLMPESGLPSDDALEPTPLEDIYPVNGDHDHGEHADHDHNDADLLSIYAERTEDVGGESALPGDIPTYPPIRGYVTRSFESKTALHSPGHYGLDVAAKEGSPILASANGLVLFAGWSYPYGHLVVIAHKSGYNTFYGHNQLLLVEPGDRVLQGQPIALLGNSGRSSAPHLHFEIWKDGVRLDPETILAHVVG